MIDQRKRTRAEEYQKPSAVSDSKLDFVSVAQALVVADYASFSRAARALGIQQSLVSRRIRSLEDKLGVSLFERNRDGVLLTDAGRNFTDRMRQIFDEIELVAKEAATAGRGTDGVVRFGVSAPLSDFLVALIREFRIDHKGVRFEFHEGTRRSNTARIMDRSVDVAILAQIAESPDITMVPLWSSPIYVAIPDAHDLALGSQIEWSYLRDETFLFGMNEDASELRDIVLYRFGEFDQPPKIENYAVNQRSVLQFVAMGCGVTLISEPGALMQQQGVIFRPLADSSATLTYAAVWLRENDNPALRRFLSLARTMAKKG